MDTIGLVGVGFVGERFARSLADAGYGTVAYDPDDARMAVAAECGATQASSPTVVAERSDAVVLALPGTPEVEATVLHDPFLEALSGGLIVDATTTHPETGVRCAERCTDAAVEYVAAPLTRGAPREGTLLMVGANESAYDRATPLLEAISDDHRRIGPVGDGRRLKLALQLRYALRSAVDAEVVAFAREAGVDPELLNEYLGMAISERYFEGDYTSDVTGMGALAIWHKDLGYALDVGRTTDVPLPLSAAGHELYEAGLRAAKPDEKRPEAVQYYWRRPSDE